jgi:four helix bundle protein
VGSAQWPVARLRRYRRKGLEMPVQNYRELIAWQKAMDFAEFVYQTTRGFPKEELYGLASQLRRAVISISSNIAEGQGRRSTGEFRQFLRNARGSLFEVEPQILLAQRFRYLNPTQTEQLLDRASELGRILNGLMAALQRTSGRDSEH